MVEVQHQKIQDFVMYTEFIIPAINNYFSNCLGKEMIINASSPTLGKPLVIEKDQTTSEYISVMSFIELIAKRWKEELNYHDEIINLKENIYEEYKKLGALLLNEEAANYLEDQAILLVDKIFNFIRFDEKQMAEEFCNGLINGYEIEMLGNFAKYAYYILWAPYLTPYPVGLIELIKTNFQLISPESTLLTIKELTSKILGYTMQYLQPACVDPNDFKENFEFKAFLQKITDERKTCSMRVNQNNTFLPVLMEYKSKCIENIEVSLTYKIFVEKSISFSYDSLEILDRIHKDKVSIVLSKFPLGLRSLTLIFHEFETKHIEILANNLSILFFLDRIKLCFIGGNNRITDEEVQLITKSLMNKKRMKEFSLDFRQGNNNVTGEGLTIISSVINNLWLLESLVLNFQKNAISSNSIEVLANSIKNCKYLKTFSLDISYNKNPIENGVFVFLMKALKELKFICHLSFNLTNHYSYYSTKENLIKDETIKVLAEDFQHMIQLQTLVLKLQYNYGISNMGAIALFEGLSHVKDLKKLTFDARHTYVNYKFESYVDKLKMQNKQLEIDFKYQQ